MLRNRLCSRCRIALHTVRHLSTGPEPAPPMLSKIRNDLKAAMKAKDTTRLNVLRSIISEASNASKGPSPIKTDLQVLAILRKKSSASKAAAQEFAENQREDLKQKQEAEIKVLDEYAGQVETTSEEEISVAVDEVVRSIGEQGGTINAGQLMKELFKPGGKLKDKPVEKGRVAQMIKTRLT